MPGECATVERRREAWLAVLEFDAQQLREQVVEAVPLALIVERQEKQIRPRERGQPLVGPFLFDHRVAQRAGQPFEDRGTQHEGLRLWIVCFEHLVDEEVDDERLPPPNLLTKACRSSTPWSERAAR